MGYPYQPAVSILAAGANITTTGTSARAAIPVTLSGDIARYIRVAALNACHVRLGTVTVTASATDTLVQPADSLVMHVPNGITHIAAIQDSAGGTVNVAPLENS